MMREGGGVWLWPRELFEDGWGEIIKNSSNNNNDGKKWMQQYGRVSQLDEVTHRFEVRTMGVGVDAGACAWISFWKGVGF